MRDAKPVVFVVDDDPSVRKALGRLLRTAKLRVEVFASAQEFLKHDLPDAPACLVLDVRMPGVDGLDLQATLNETGIDLPIVFITGHGDIRMTVRAMKAGAVDFLPKPFEDQHLIDTVRQAVGKHARARRENAEMGELQQRAASLTDREREVMTLVVSGLLNKQIGQKLGITEGTIKVHRGHVMQKMQAGSLAELVRIAERIGIGAASPQPVEVSQ